MRSRSRKARKRPLRTFALGAAGLLVVLLLAGALMIASGRSQPKPAVALDDALENKVLSAIEAQKSIPADHSVIAYSDGGVFVVFSGAESELGGGRAAGAVAHSLADAVFAVAPEARTVSVAVDDRRVIGTFDRADDPGADAATSAIAPAKPDASTVSVASTTTLLAPPSVHSDTTLSVTGQVSPDTAEGKVKIRLYRLIGPAWRPAGVYTVALSGGTFASSFKPTFKGVWRVRADYLGSAALRVASSQSAYVSTVVR